MYKIIGSDQKIYGPITAELIRQWLAEGRLNAATLVQTEGSTEWRALSTFPEFAPPPPPPPTSAPVLVSAIPPQPPQPAVVVAASNEYATWGFILGLLSVIPCCCCGVVFSIAGVVLSAIALNRANQLPRQEGKALAIAGLILSIIGLAAGAISPFLISLFQHGPGNFHYRWNW